MRGPSRRTIPYRTVSASLNTKVRGLELVLMISFVAMAFSLSRSFPFADTNTRLDFILPKGNNGPY